VGSCKLPRGMILDDLSTAPPPAPASRAGGHVTGLPNDAYDCRGDFPPVAGTAGDQVLPLLTMCPPISFLPIPIIAARQMLSRRWAKS